MATLIEHTKHAPVNKVSKMRTMVFASFVLVTVVDVTASIAWIEPGPGMDGRSETDERLRD